MVIDAEGMEVKIIQSNDWQNSLCRPDLIIVDFSNYPDVQAAE